MRLFETGIIGRLRLKNRVVMAAMGTGLIELDGRITQRLIDFYASRARGGVALMITGAIRVTRHIEQLPFAPLGDALVVDGKMYTNRLAELADAVHDYGAKIALQLMAGRGRVWKNIGAVAPSRLPVYEAPSITTRELTKEEIERLVRSFRVAAEVARGAGMDAIEVNSHYGYLCDQFLTGLWNKRTDKYGGDLEGRLTFLLEVIDNIKQGAGNDFPIIVKYGLTHYFDGGRTVEEGLEIARRLEAAGVSALGIEAGCYETLYFGKPTTYSPPGPLVELAGMVKNVVSIPVIAIGKLGQPELAERVLQEGKADFIALGRPLLADVDWVNKVKQGRVEDICPCVGDHEGCNGRLLEGMAVSCTVNPACGNERELNICRAEKKKRVLVVGGGPGGMEAARVAALRGHSVTLWEKTDVMGGTLAPASIPSFKQDYRKLIEYLYVQLRKHGVTVELQKEATAELVRKMKPEVVFIATGGVPIIPQIPGMDRKNTLMAADALSGKRKIGKSVAIIGGGAVGCELALYLAQNGKGVTIIEMLDTVAGDMFWVNRMHLFKLLGDAGVKIMKGTTVSQGAGANIITTDKSGNRNVLKAETIILACGLRPDDRLFEDLKDSVPELYAVGDCVEPRNVLHAMKDGYRLARLI